MFNTNMLKKLLNDNQMSQKELAERAKLSPCTISRIMLTNRANYKSIKKISEVFNIDHKTLII